MSRIIMVVTVALVMAAMMLAMAMPAFALKGDDPAGNGYGSDYKKECKASGGTHVKDSAPGGGPKHQECQF